MLLGIYLSISSYDLGKRAGTRRIVHTNPSGWKTYTTSSTDEDKIKSYTESYRGIGYIILLIGGMGLITVMLKEK